MKRFLLLPVAIAAAAAPALAQIEWRHHRPTNSGILGDYVQALFIDEQDRPWIAAYTPFWEEGGMSRRNADGTFELLTSFEVPEISSPRFHDIVRDAAGTMWIASKGGLLRYDPDVGPSSLVRYDRYNAPLPGHEVSDLDVAPDGTVWLAIYNVSSAPQGGLARYTPSSDTWQVWTTANGLTWGGGWPGWDAVGHVAVRADASGDGYTVWFGSPHNLGMGTWREGTFTWLGNPQNPPPGRYPLRFMSNDPIDEQGNLWVLTNQGLMRQDASGTELVVGYPAGLGSEVSRVVALSGGRAALGTFYADVFLWSGGWIPLGNWGSVNHTYALAEDSTGALWAGGIGGAAKRENGVWQRYRSTNTGMIGFWTQAIDFAPDGRVFLNGNAAAGAGGFDVFDGVRWTNANDHTYGLGHTWGLPSDNVRALCFRASGTLALAPSGGQGLVEWDGASYTYLIPQGFTIVEVDEDSLERLWAVHYSSGGVSRITGTQVVRYMASNSPLPGGAIGSVEVDDTAPGFVWITTRFGIAHTDGDVWTIYPRELLGLTQNTTAELLSAAAPHPDGTLWVGSYSGVFHFDPATSQYVRYHSGNSALPTNDVHHVHVAPDGSVWVASFGSVFPYQGGLTRFEGAHSTHYSAGDSPLPHNQIWVLQSRSVPAGYELWVGTASEAVAVLTVAPSYRSHCAGDGSGTPCPCGNEGAAGHGCANGSQAGGALLAAQGSASVVRADLRLHASGLVPFQPGLYFQGDDALAGGSGILFGDGLRCAGGNVRRLEIASADGDGSSSTSVALPAQGGAQPGDLLHYQLWYRDPATSPCGYGFNLTNAVEVLWGP